MLQPEKQSINPRQILSWALDHFVGKVSFPMVCVPVKWAEPRATDHMVSLTFIQTDAFRGNGTDRVAAHRRQGKWDH